MKRVLAIAVVAATLSFLALPSTASARDHHRGHHSSHHHGHHHHGHHSSHYRGGHGFHSSGYRHHGYSPYSRSYRYRSGYGARPYGYGSGYRYGRYPSGSFGSGLHLDINGVHIFGRHHF